MDSNLAVHVKDLTKAFQSTIVLKNINMQVEAGTIYGLLGSSGCGKTTLLSCIAGIRKFDQGQIMVFGENLSGVLGSKVGFMPQDIALVNEFTVKDTLYFFGRIYNMNRAKIEERYQELSKLLELPPENRLIENCSGGEKRRVSFAAALVHNPKLLILDEPSVGVDPILRERVWNYLLDITAREKVTVILTTHYIDEAKQAHKIGFLRKGSIITEKCPKQLISAFGCLTLEEAFFKLSEAQNKTLDTLNEITTTTNTESAVLDSVGTTSSSTSSFRNFEITDGSCEVQTDKKEKRKTSHSYIASNRLHALAFKNYRQLLGNKFGFVTIILLPLFQLGLIFLSVGRHIDDIPLAIVNEESNCLDTNSTATGIDWVCHVNNISCRLVEYLEDPMIIKKHYDDFPTAFEAAKHGKVTGVVHINKNISALMEYRINHSPLHYDELTENEIEVYLDMSLIQMGGELKFKLSDLYNNFFDSIFRDCNLPAKAGKLPISIEESFHKINSNDPFVIFLTPGLSLSLVFFVGMFLTSFIVVMEKSTGTWERSIIAGVTTVELFISHLVVQSIEMFLLSLSLLLSIIFIFKDEIYGSSFDMFVLIFMQAVVGLFFGFFVSSFCNTYFMANVIVTALMNPAILLSGILWPVEAMPIIMQFISKVTPLTFCVDALRKVMRKGTGLSSPNVLLGIGVPMVWVFFLGLVSICIVKVQR